MRSFVRRSFSHYDEMGLGKAKDSTFEEIKQAYLINSLKYHPHKDMTAFDKHYAKANFVRQYQAFEVLHNKKARARYDAALNGGHHLDLYAEASAYKRASAYFHGYFGKHLWRKWELGTQVSGTVHRHGKKYMVTIYPDGTSSEERLPGETKHEEHGFHLLLHELPKGGILAANFIPESVHQFHIGSFQLGNYIFALVAISPTLLVVAAFVVFCYKMCCAPKPRKKRKKGAKYYD